MFTAFNCLNFVQVMRLPLKIQVSYCTYSLLKLANNPKTLSNSMFRISNSIKCSENFHKVGRFSGIVDRLALGSHFEGFNYRSHIIDSVYWGQKEICMCSCKGKNRQETRKNRKWTYSSLLALTLFSAKSEEEKESELIIMIKRGILALKNGELNKAEQLLHVALKTAQETQNELAVTYIYDLLANLAYQREEYSKAEKLFKEVLQRMFSGGIAEDDNAVVEISLKLASVYASVMDYEKAVEGFRFCIGTQEEKIKNYGEKDLDEDTLLLWAMSMDWYARFLLKINKYDIAKKHFIKALEMSERINGPSHSQTAVLLNDIGSVCSLQKNYVEAVEYLEKAIEAARTSESEDIGSFYVNLGTVYLQQGMLTEAQRCCKEGWTLSKKMNNKDAAEEAEICLAELKNMIKNKT